MNILMVSSYLPYPLYSGGQVRLYNLIKELSVKHEITLICEKRANQTQQDIETVEKICKKVITVERQKQWTLSNMIKSGSSEHSFLVTGHTHKLMQQKIQEELANQWYDLVHVETYYVYQNLPDSLVPVVLVEHNIEYKVYEKYVSRAPFFLRPLLAVDVLKIKKEEEFCWKESEALVAVSREDQRIMETVGCKPALVANGVNTEHFSFKDKSTLAKKERKILFIGDYKWIQNTDAVSFLITEIWPEINKKVQTTNVKLWIVGRKIPEAIRNLTNDPSVLFDEESSSKPTPEIFQEADVLLAPIRVGGGTSYKILESMSCGTPVVTMKLSADALEAKDGESLLVGNSATDLANKTDILLHDANLYKQISKGGRLFVEENYRWEKIAKRLDDVYTDVVSKEKQT
jgi:glycosyltransferase involved in cell wall biosynthesis